MNKLHLFTFIGISLIVGACGQNPAVTAAAEATATLTPDPCVGFALSESVKPINDLQREFDDASALAANLPREQLSDVITNLQRIRRAAEDVTPPTCLSALKSYQLTHMNAVIDTLLAFVGGADNATLNAGMTQAQDSHDQYTLELARLLGASPSPVSTP
ncbi:MAG: hypothetical protein IT314_00650 [Anaerolineales bacterium]|nr:hypothetical protein [Anaerolineales bacterium]